MEEENYNKCPFCDLLLQSTFLKDKLQGRSFSDQTDDFCTDDCLKETLNVNCVEEEAFVEVDNFGYIPRARLNFDELSVSDASSADDSDIDYIFEKELSELDAVSKDEEVVERTTQMEVD